MKESRPLALIVDDEPDLCELIQLTLKRMSIDSDTAGDLGQARNKLQDGAFDLCLTDLRLPDGSGIELVHYIQDHKPDTPVAVITAHADMQTAIDSMKACAFDFVSKPVDLTVLRRLVDNALRLQGNAGSAAPDDMIGASPAIETLRKTIVKVARSQAPVCLVGPSGAGKELAARMIHRSGPRSDGPFVPVNCGALPGELLESDLFGHIKGAFTGAANDKAGLFQTAAGGTLFLDEVTELPLNLQVKLLRALQEKSIRPVGSNQEIATDVRILSATNRDMTTLLTKGQFREDLYYRINVIEVQVPSLAQRRDDIPLLVDALLTKIAREQDGIAPSVSDEALTLLIGYDFPGNVRELENILARASALCENGVVDAMDLGISSPQDHATAATASTSSAQNLDDELEALEAARIREALENQRYNKTAAAKALGMTLRQLRYRLKKLGVE